MVDYTKMKGDMANLVAATASKPAAPASKVQSYSEREPAKAYRDKIKKLGIPNAPGGGG